MPRKESKHKFIGKRWVHAFEEDTSDGEVYRPDDENVPLSRRPREAFELNPDGTARVFRPAPDDRMTPTEASWTDEGDAVVLRAPAGSGSRSVQLRITEAGPDRLLVKR